MDLVDRGVPLTGQTLAASLKLRCDTSGADYAIFWSRIGDSFKVTGTHIASGATAKYVESSKAVTLDANGNGPIATVKRTQEAFWVPSIEDATVLKRRELARQGSIKQIAFVPFEGGVLEFGNAKESVVWDGIPDTPTIPKAELRKAFEELGALYAMYWRLDDDGKFRVAGEYENPRDKKTRLRLRGDGSSFPSISAQYELDGEGDGPIASALRQDEEIVVTFAAGSEYTTSASMKRAERAKEFNIGAIHAVPIIDRDTGRKRGVLEYGVNNNKVFNEVPMDATLKLQTEGSGASYAIYWAQEGGVAKVKKTFISSAYRAALAKAGKKVRAWGGAWSVAWGGAWDCFFGGGQELSLESAPLRACPRLLWTASLTALVCLLCAWQLSYPEVSEGLTFEISEESPVARVMRTRQAVYVSDIAESTDDSRSTLGDEYMIEQVAFVPVLGGVIEYGAARGKGVWKDESEALIQLIPNEPIEEAFAAGATYAIYWQRNEAKGVYEVAVRRAHLGTRRAPP